MDKKQNGFSLVELLIGMVILVMLLAAMAGVVSVGFKSSQFNLSMGHILAPGRNALNAISDSLRYDPVTITLPLTGASGSQFNYTDSTSNTYTITRNSSTRSIIMAKNGITTSTLAAGLVDSITFTRDSSDVRTVIVTIVLNDKAYTGSPSRTISETIVMWNVTS
jgi:prepilin-type N-terminal cleavage/methylation domain-containing protein